LSGAGKKGVTTELPAPTTLLQSRSTREDSEKRGKSFLKTVNEWTTAIDPSGFLPSHVKGMINIRFASSSSVWRALTRRRVVPIEDRNRIDIWMLKDLVITVLSENLTELGLVFIVWTDG